MLFKFQSLKRLSGVLGVLVIWIGVALAMSIAGLKFFDTRPISYLGVYAPTSQLFSITLLVSSFLFLIFGLYVKQKYHVKNKFLAFLIIGQIGQIITAITPYGDRNPYRLLHTFAAFTLAFSLPLLISQFAASQTNSPHHNTYVRLLRLEQITFILGIGLFVFTEGIAPLGEALPALGYHIWIITITILSLKNHEPNHS